MEQKFKLKPEIVKRLKDIKEHPETMISHEEMMRRLDLCPLPDKKQE